MKGSVKVSLIEKAGISNEMGQRNYKARLSSELLSPKDFLLNFKPNNDNTNMSSSLSSTSFNYKPSPKLAKLDLGNSGNQTSTNQKTRLPSIEHQYSRGFLDTNETKNSFLDIRKILYETNRKKRDHIGTNKFSNKKIKEDDYEEIDNDNYEEDLMNVKTLEKWNIELKKNKSSHLNKLDQILPLAQKKDLDVKDEYDLTPKVKIELINQIWTDFDSEKKTLINYANDLLANEENDDQTNKLSNKMQGSLEFSMQDSTANIFDDLIMKKIKKQLDSGEFDHQREDQLFFSIQKAADEVLGQFQSLKVVSSNLGIQNHIMRIIKKIKSRKQDIDKMFDFSKEPNPDKKDALDYKTSENILIKSYEKTTSEIQLIRNRFDDVTRVLHDARFHVREEFSQLDQIRKTIAEIDDKPEAVNKVEKASKRGNASVVEEYLRAQRIKAELRKQEQTVASAVTELEGLIRRSQAELELLEGDLRNAKNNKAYTKLRLKELYLKLLKDQNELLTGDHQTNLVWIARALGKVDQEVTPHIFPDYLDRENVHFLLEMAKLQEEFEAHCKRYNLSGFNSAFEDFANLKVLESHKEIERYEEDKKVDLHRTMATLARSKDRDINTLMTEIQGKIIDLKRGNLKAKRQVTMYQRSSKGKIVTKKYEEVNPYDTSIPLLDYNGQVYKSYYEQNSEADYAKRSNSKETSFKLEEGVIPLEKANALNKKIENLKKQEANRIIKGNLGRDIDFDKVTKIFKALFSKKEAQEYIQQYMREKRAMDIKLTNSTKISGAKMDRGNSLERVQRFSTTGTLSLPQREQSPAQKLFTQTTGGLSSPTIYNPRENRF